MSSLTPNSPRKRLEWVRKTYWKKDPFAVLSTYAIAVHLFGLETRDFLGRSPDFRDARGPHTFDDEIGSISDDMAANYEVPYDDSVAEKRVVRLEEKIGKEVPRHELDFILPWAARELVKLYAAVMKGEVPDGDADHASNLLRQKATAIATWARETRTDLGRVSLAQALEAVGSHAFKQGQIPQGTVVFTFPDGWTVQELRGDPSLAGEVEAGSHLPMLQEQLAAEGRAMQHCVGGYCEAVEGGESRIYSLRDPNGNPHVTLEWQPSNPDDWADWGPIRFMNVYPRPRGHFVQIMGKQNEAPAEKYRPYVVKFINKAFDGDPVGLLLAREDPSKINFKRLGRHGLKEANVFLENMNLSGADLSQMDLREMTFEGTDLSGADLSFSDARGAHFARADLSGANVRGLDVRDAYLYRSNLLSAKNLDKLRFDGTTEFPDLSFDQMREIFGVTWNERLGSWEDEHGLSPGRAERGH